MRVYYPYFGLFLYLEITMIECYCWKCKKVKRAKAFSKKMFLRPSKVCKSCTHKYWESQGRRSFKEYIKKSVSLRPVQDLIWLDESVEVLEDRKAIRLKKKQEQYIANSLIINKYLYYKYIQRYLMFVSCPCLI